MAAINLLVAAPSVPLSHGVPRVPFHPQRRGAIRRRTLAETRGRLSADVTPMLALAGGTTRDDDRDDLSTYSCSIAVRSTRGQLRLRPWLQRILAKFAQPQVDDAQLADQRFMPGAHRRQPTRWSANIAS